MCFTLDAIKHSKKIVVLFLNFTLEKAEQADHNSYNMSATVFILNDKK